MRLFINISIDIEKVGKKFYLSKNFEIIHVLIDNDYFNNKKSHDYC
jgi:hypothetical protein